jgi:hypothetical protein
MGGRDLTRAPTRGGEGGPGPGEPTVRVELVERFLRATPEQMTAIERILLGADSEGGKPETEIRSGEVIQREGRFAYREGFADVWLGEQHFNLRRRAKARACLRYLVEHHAFDEDSARDLIQEIDPYVRAQCQLPALPGYGELKIHHYFNPSTSDTARLGRELIRPAGRNGRYFLEVK